MELLLRYIFLLKVQKKVIKISKPKEKKNKKEEESGVGMRQKKYIPQYFSPFHFIFFSLYCQERHGMDSSSREKKKRLRKILTSYPFSLLLFLLSSGVGTGDVTQRPAAKSSSAKLSLCKYRLGNTGGAGERNRPGKRNNPPPHPERTMPRERRCSPPPPPSPPCCVSCLVGAGAA